MWCIIDFFSGNPYAVTNFDGETLWFETEKDAKEFAEGNLQEGYWQAVQDPTH